MESRRAVFGRVLSPVLDQEGDGRVARDVLRWIPFLGERELQPQCVEGVQRALPRGAESFEVQRLAELAHDLFDVAPRIPGQHRVREHSLLGGRQRVRTTRVG